MVGRAAIETSAVSAASAVPFSVPVSVAKAAAADLDSAIATLVRVVDVASAASAVPAPAAVRVARGRSSAAKMVNRAASGTSVKVAFRRSSVPVKVAKGTKAATTAVHASVAEIPASVVD